MSDFKFGSARCDEAGNYVGGKAGDQTGREVMIQPFYQHKKGWYILRLKDIKKAELLGNAMKRACNNPNIGYNQAKRNEVISAGVDTQKKVNCDCSSLVRACLKSVGIDVKDFTTETEVKILMATGLFEKHEATTILYKGDIAVTRTKGHTGIITDSSLIRSTKIYAVAIPTERKKVQKTSRTRYTVSLNVRLLQINLNELCGQNLKEDGKFGEKTEEAVKNLQRVFFKRPEDIDGIYGPKTYECLKFVAACKGYEVL